MFNKYYEVLDIAPTASDEEIKKVDYAFLDATFYSGKEINNRDISEIPHPFIIENIICAW